MTLLCKNNLRAKIYSMHITSTVRHWVLAIWLGLYFNIGEQHENTSSFHVVIVVRESTSVQTIRLCRRRFATNRANRIESLTIWYPSYCRDDSRRIESIWHPSYRLSVCCHVLRTRKVHAIIFSWVSVSRGAYRLRANRVESLSLSHESTQVCRHVSRTRNVHVSLFHGSWLPVVRIDSVRIESNRQVPQTNRL